ncbi:MAG: FecR domain-containing protein [Acidobacteriota bacterium]|nr:FecR domain-containing protein [Acidobacteriota bacterium]
MRKLTLALLSTLTLAFPLYAAQGREQSYFTYDDGGTIVRQGDDGRETEARVNYPIFAGDEITTNRRGRAEIRLSDGNIIALDRSTSIRFRSINDSYDDSSTQTVVELRYGHVIAQRTDFNREALRLDTNSASYFAADQAIYAVDNDGRAADRVSVFYGEIEVRTPVRTSQVREGEEGHVDDQGVYGLVSSQRGTADEFERWFIRRSERYGKGTSRYLDRSLSYSDYDLEQYGSWTYVSGLGSWGWRPSVGAGWRPYYAGNWVYGPGGALVWVSSEPWGWVPYHYGRWAYDAGFGWVWLPGYTYSPAWVYWMYGPGYFGWAPAGWYDCYRPYYGWAYQPYSRAGLNFGFGFYGRVRVNEIDLRPWTFMSGDRIMSTRVDQAALTTDAIRQRLQRGDANRDVAVVSGLPARFSRSEIKDPASAINTIARRGIGSGTGKEGSGSATDMTPFFRRDPDLSNAIRERIVRSAVITGGTTSIVSSPRGGGLAAGSGVPSPGTPGTIEGRIPPHGDSPDAGRATVPRDRFRDNPAGGISTPQSPSTIDRGAERNWRDRLDRSNAPAAPATPVERAPADKAPAPTPSRDDSWRGRVSGRRDATPRADAPVDKAPVDRSFVDRKPADRAPADRGSDIPRRIIDRIGGARIYGGDTPPRDSTPRQSSAPREAPPPHVERSSPPPPPPKESAPPPSRSNDGGHVKRDH